MRRKERIEIPLRKISVSLIERQYRQRDSIGVQCHDFGGVFFYSVSDFYRCPYPTVSDHAYLAGNTLVKIAAPLPLLVFFVYISCVYTYA